MRKLAPLAAGALILAFFFGLAGGGLGAHFAPDDLENLYRYWEAGGAKVLQANLLFYSSFYRPAGGLYYLPLWRWFGFDPLPYRLVCFALLVANLCLFYRFAWLITGRRQAAVLATLIGCFHAGMLSIFYSNSTIYDILCFFFFFAAAIYYLGLRRRGLVPNAWQSGLVLVLYIGALDAKEMAVTLPLCLLVWEGIENPPHVRRLGAVAKWAMAEGRGALLTGLASAVYVCGKMTGPNSLASVADYRPVFTLHRFLTTAAAYMNLLFYQERWFSQARTLALWGLLILAAWALKSRALRFSGLFTIMTLAPLYFLPPREGFVLYIPIAGWSIYAATLILLARDRWAPRLPVAVVLVAAAALLAPVHAARSRRILPYLLHAQDYTWQGIKALDDLHPQLPHQAAVLIENNPFGQQWDMYFLAKVYFDDPTVKVALVDKPGAAPRGDVQDHYDYRLIFRDGKFFLEPPASGSSSWRSSPVPFANAGGFSRMM